MTITMRFGSSRIDDLQAQTSKDEFKNHYEQIILSNMSSNYHKWQRYESMVISIKSWTNGFTYNFNKEKESDSNFDYTWYSNPNFQITDLTFKWESVQEIKSELIPYQIWCKINEWSWLATIKTKSKDKIACFQINSNNCKLENIKCDSENL